MQFHNNGNFLGVTKWWAYFDPPPLVLSIYSTKFCYTSCTSLFICNFPNPRHLAQKHCNQVTKEHCIPKANKIVKELTNKIPREECHDSVQRICHQVPVTKPKQECQNLTTEACQVWQYRLWIFQGRDTKLERFLAKNQL